MTSPLTIAILRAGFHPESTGGRVFEEEVLAAALSASTPHRLVVYPKTAEVQALVDERGIGHRVSLVRKVTRPMLPKRVLRRAKRTILRRARPLPSAELTGALRDAGADCVWMLGGTLAALDLPYVATIWDLQHRVQPWFPEVSSDGEWKAREAINAECIRRASALLVGTSEGAREIREAYGDPARALNVVPLPTPSYAVEAGLRPRGPRPADLPANYLLYPAQFWPHKNHVTAVRTLVALGESGYAPHLVLVGNDRGNRDHVLRLAQRLGVAHRVHVMGFVPTPRLVSLYQHADALLFPSLFGPDNLPPLEAMALGCPVIAARVPGAEEQLGDAALLVDGLDAEAFAAAARSLRDAPMRADEMIERGRKRARAWTATHYASAVLDIFSARIAPMRALWP